LQPTSQWEIKNFSPKTKPKLITFLYVLGLQKLILLYISGKLVGQINTNKSNQKVKLYLTEYSRDCPWTGFDSIPVIGTMYLE
jgi:hypothetical protein